jgi:nucleoside-diphosphate-sugar epimerase
VNLGNPEELLIAELAELVRSLTGSPSCLEHRPLPSDDPVRRRPDIAKAHQVLGWWPRVRVRDGLRATIEHFQRLLQPPPIAAPSTSARAPGASPR